MPIAVIPPYIINNNNKEVDNRIQLEIPDYSAEYEEWLRKKDQENNKKEESTVIVIDIY